MSALGLHTCANTNACMHALQAHDEKEMAGWSRRPYLTHARRYAAVNHNVSCDFLLLFIDALHPMQRCSFVPLSICNVCVM